MRTLLRTIPHLCLLLALAMFGAGCKKAQAKISGVGDSLQPFIVMSAESGDRYCQVCAYAGKPKIMFVADMDDASVEADLIRIQKLVERFQDRGLVAFALFGEIENGKFTPVSDDHKASSHLESLRQRLQLSYPVTIVPTSYTEKERKGYTPFVDSYDIPTSRRLLYADVTNEVMFAETIREGEAEAQFAKLEAELSKI